MVDEVNLSRQSIQDIARAFADELNGSGRSSTIGGAGGGGGGGGANRRISKDLVDGLFKDIVPGFNRSFAQMANGATGLSSFNAAIDGSADALTRLSGNLLQKMPGLATALGITTEALSSYTQQVNSLADAQYDAYVEMSKVGSADRISGLGGVMDMFNKFGYTSSRDFPKLTALINENAEAFASFGGTVETGMDQFANVTAIMQKTGMQAELMQMGIQPDEINKRFAAMLKQVQLAGGSIANLGKEELERARSVRDYIKQQDIITRLTGLTADQQQKTLEQAIANDAYAVRRYQLEQERDAAIASGDKDRIQAAKAALMQDEFILANAKKMGPEAFAGMQDILVGRSSEAALKLRFSIGEEATRLAQLVPKTFQEAAENVVDSSQAATTGVKNYIDAFGRNIQLDTTGRANFGIAINEQLKMAGQTMDRAAIAKAMTEQGEPPPGTGIPPPSESTLVNVVAVRQEIMRATSAFENFVNAGMKPISDIMVVAAATMRGVAEALPGSTPKFLKDNEALKKQMETETGIKGIGTLRGTGEFMNETRTSANALANSTIQSAEKIAADAAAKAKEITDRTLEMTKDWLNSIVGAGESVPDAMTASATQIDQATGTLVSSLRNIGQSVSPGAGINLNSSNMSRLLANFRNSTGPNDNYRQSLVDTVYRPDAEDNDSRLAAASGALAGIGTGSEISRDQMVAYETMIRQQGELIDLLQRSVGIQDKTLRATYNT